MMAVVSSERAYRSRNPFSLDSSNLGRGRLLDLGCEGYNRRVSGYESHSDQNKGPARQ
jgi:hypothetical protein